MEAKRDLFGVHLYEISIDYHTVLKVILTFKKLSMNKNACIAEHSTMHLFNSKSTFGMYPLCIQDLSFVN